MGKWLWVSAVIIFAIHYAWPRRAELSNAIETLGWGPICFAFFLIVIAKLGMVVNMRLACKKFGIYLSWWDSFGIYNYTQLAKYMPGSVWQFVGRIAIFKSRGYDSRAISHTLLAEHSWMIFVAGLLGIYPLLLDINAYIELLDWSGMQFEQLENTYVWSAVCVVFVCIFPFMIAWHRGSKVQRFLRWLVELTPSWKVITFLFVTWVLFGSSLWVMLLPFFENTSPFANIIGLYCLAWVIGFLAPFAPAGLGVREIVLVLGLSAWVNADVALLLASLNRLVYFLAELFLAAVGAYKSKHTLWQ